MQTRGIPIRLTNPHSLGDSSVNLGVERGSDSPAWLLTVKFDYCNNLLSSVHTDCIILRSVTFDY